MPDRERWTIDSIEEDVAALVGDDGRHFHLPRRLLPAGAREGDVLAVARETRRDGLTLRLEVAVDRGATERALARSRRQVTETRTDHDPGGDIVL